MRLYKIHFMLVDRYTETNPVTRHFDRVYILAKDTAAVMVWLNTLIDKPFWIGSDQYHCHECELLGLEMPAFNMVVGPDGTLVANNTNHKIVNSDGRDS